MHALDTTGGNILVGLIVVLLGIWQGDGHHGSELIMFGLGILGRSMMGAGNDGKHRNERQGAADDTRETGGTR